MYCTGERSAIATNAYVGKGSSPWSRKLEPTKVIVFDPFARSGQTKQLCRVAAIYRGVLTLFAAFDLLLRLEPVWQDQHNLTKTGVYIFSLFPVGSGLLSG
jgi:hypothetical protein